MGVTRVRQRNFPPMALPQLLKGLALEGRDGTPGKKGTAGGIEARRKGGLAYIVLCSFKGQEGKISKLTLDSCSLN